MFSTFTSRQKYGLVIGPVLFIAVLCSALPEGMSPAALKVAAVALLMASFWIGETIPIPVTAVFPIFLFPILGVMPTKDVTVAYGNQILFLFMGGFLIAVAMQHWNLHKRIALNVIDRVGSSPQRLILGFMLATAALSMWISNSATAMMMMPVALAVIEQTRKDHEQAASVMTGAVPESSEHTHDNVFATALMLAIAYGASIGGVSTLVGTPPNSIFIGIIDTLYGYEINFVDWMKLGVPLSLVMLSVCWWVLTRGAFKLPDADKHSESAKVHIKEQLSSMGSITKEEKRVACVFAFVALSWIVNGLFEPEFLSLVSDSSIAMFGACLLFILPASRQEGFLLTWDTAKTIPWDIILLMGGGFALAAGFSHSGLTEWLANRMTVFQAVHYFVLIVVVVLMVTFLTEISSNAATASLFIPVMGALAIAMDLHPFTLMVPAALAASMAFMLPVATPPNAIIFGSRCVSVSQMVKAGLWLNLISAAVISILCYFMLDLLQ